MAYCLDKNDFAVTIDQKACWNGECFGMALTPEEKSTYCRLKGSGESTVESDALEGFEARHHFDIVLYNASNIGAAPHVECLEGSRPRFISLEGHKKRENM